MPTDGRVRKHADVGGHITERREVGRGHTAAVLVNDDPGVCDVVASESALSPLRRCHAVSQSMQVVRFGSAHDGVPRNREEVRSIQKRVHAEMIFELSAKQCWSLVRQLIYGLLLAAGYIVGRTMLCIPQPT